MVRGAGGRRGVTGGGGGRGRGGRGGDHLGMGLLASDGAAAVPVDADGAPIAADAQGGLINNVYYERSHERFTWKGMLRPHADCMKRTKILPQARSRRKNVPGSCVYSSIATALEANNRACGVEVGELAWEELSEMVKEDNPQRITAALRVLKYHGIRSKADYEKREFNGKRFKVSQFCEFCNIGMIDDNVVSGLDRHNIKAAIDNMLSKSVILTHFPVSYNYLDLYEEEHIYAYDVDNPILQETDDLEERISTHVVVVTGFGFEEEIPYFEFLDCNGQAFGNKGFGRILPSSIISLFAFDVIVD